MFHNYTYLESKLEVTVITDICANTKQMRLKSIGRTNNINSVDLFAKFAIIYAWQRFGNRKSESQNKLCN